jgi:hypothetical protein
MYAMHAVSNMLGKSPPQRGSGAEDVILATSNTASTIETYNAGPVDGASDNVLEAQGARLHVEFGIL